MICRRFWPVGGISANVPCLGTDGGFSGNPPQRSRSPKRLNLLEGRPDRRRRAGYKSSKRVHDGEPPPRFTDLADDYRFDVGIFVPASSGAAAERAVIVMGKRRQLIRCWTKPEHKPSVRGGHYRPEYSRPAIAAPIPPQRK